MVNRRDNGICCICKKSHIGSEELHHVYYGGEANRSPERNDPDQIVAIHRDCHARIHHITGKCRENREKCKDYLDSHYKIEVKTIEKGKHPLIPDSETIKIRNKHCRAEAIIHNDEMTIHYVATDRESEGLFYASSLVKQLQKYCKKRGLYLASTVPLCSTWRNICKRYDITIYE